MMHAEFRHSVVIWFDYNREDDSDFYSFSKKLDEHFEHYKDGYYDGHEIAMDNTDGSFYFYGRNAEALFKYVEPLLDACDFMRVASAVLTFDDSLEDAPSLTLVL